MHKIIIKYRGDADMSETITLGGNIELTGFSDLDRGSMIIIKKIVGSYTRKFSDSLKDFEKLVIELNEQGNEFEINAKIVVGGKKTSANTKDKNLFVALDSVLKELEKKIK
ncbi:MAG: hypothetical protein KKA61_02880 [Nanoarchaeota archaeon]|nr:hypothetical protein [Nanoarchaeota archaeon]